MNKWSFSLGVIICVTAVQLMGLYRDINGQMFLSCMALIGLICGTLLGFTYRGINVGKLPSPPPLPLTKSWKELSYDEQIKWIKEIGVLLEETAREHQK